MNEIYNIPSILWNFLNKVTATEREDKDLKKVTVGILIIWKSHSI